MEAAAADGAGKDGAAPDGRETNRSHHRACLISYADSIVPAGASGLASQHRDVEDAPSPLSLLAKLMHGNGDSGVQALSSTFPVLHVLPFYPWDTDR